MSSHARERYPVGQLDEIHKLAPLIDYASLVKWAGGRLVGKFTIFDTDLPYASPCSWRIKRNYTSFLRGITVSSLDRTNHAKVTFFGREKRDETGDFTPWDWNEMYGMDWLQKAPGRLDLISKKAFLPGDRPPVIAVETPCLEMLNPVFAEDSLLMAAEALKHTIVS